MEPTLEIFAVQINIIGNFNPPVITPAWLNSNDLIGPEDATSAMESESLAITPDISRFETEWFSIQVIKKQFVLNSKGPVTPAIKDLALGIFSFLAHTPVTALGINSLAHYKIYSIDEYHKVGDVLAPKKIWNSVYPETDNQTVGLEEIRLQISPHKRGEESSYENVKRVSLSRSDKLAHSIYMTFNDHYSLSVDKEASTTELLLNTLDGNWESSQSEAKTLFINVLNQAINS